MDTYTSKNCELIEDLRTFIKNNPFEMPTDAISINCQRGELNGFYGRHHTKETKNLMSLKKGWKHSDESKDKIRKAKTGVKRPESVGKNISNSISGDKHHMWGKSLSDEVKQRISNTKKEHPYKHNEEQRKKISEAAKLRESRKKCLI
jgi:hypothetical protein